MCACCQVAESELSAWAKRGHVWKKSKQRGKPAWVVQCHRKIIGTCRVGDIAKLRDIIQKHHAPANANATTGATATATKVGFFVLCAENAGMFEVIVRGIENGQGGRRERG